MITGLLVSLCMMSTGCPATGATDAKSNPAVTSNEPATANDWLDHFEKRLAEIKTIHADIIHIEISGLGILDNKQSKRGNLQFQAAEAETEDTPFTPAKYAIHFIRRYDNRRPEKHDMWYVFDGRWLVRRNELEKIFNKDEIVAYDAAADQRDPLTTGDGPFFFPMAAKKQQILKRFNVELISPRAADPPNTVHLRLTPKPERRMEITQLDIWYNKQNSIPVRVATLDDAPNQNVVEMKKLRLNKPIDPKVFDVSVPKGSEWHTQVKVRGQRSEVRGQ